MYYAGDVTRPGCNSELQLVDERIVGAKPRSMDFAQAAAIPLTAITAWEAFFDRMKIDPGGAQRGATLLVVGGAGGVGSIGIQLARIAGLRVVATASRPQSAAWVRELGAEWVIDHSRPMRPQLEALGMRSADYVAVFNDIDRHWQEVCELVRPQGAIVSIVAPRGPLPQDAPPGPEASKKKPAEKQKRPAPKKKPEGGKEKGEPHAEQASSVEGLSKRKPR